ncbi:MAG: hypothetical protein HC888_07195 [Candidatus Competibacteraceae bacterium]|nr:hypothetical protein [Candidatus Competibacteraceae bacterium]
METLILEIAEPEVIETRSFLAPAVEATEIDTTEIEAFHAKLTSYGKLQIVDAASQAVVVQTARAIKGHIAKVEAAFDAAGKERHKAHKAVTAEEARYVKPAKALLDKLEKAILAFQRAVEAAEMQARAKAAAEEEAKKKAEQAQADDGPNFFMDDETPTALDDLPNITPIAVSSGYAMPVDTKRGRARADVDKIQLIIACAERLKKGDMLLLNCLDVNQPACNALATAHGEQLHLIIPGAKCVRDEKVKL